MDESRIVLRPSAAISLPHEKNGAVLLDNGNSILRWTRVAPSVLQALGMLKQGVCSVTDWVRGLGEKNASYLIQELESAGIVRSAYENQFVDTKHEKHVDFYAEFLEDPNAAIRELQEKKMLVLGLGGVGCVAIQHLIGAGIKHFVLVDFDVVCHSNLNRQFCYTPNDLGRKKTDVMREYIASHESDSSIATYSRTIRSVEDLDGIIMAHQDIDMVACCFDNEIAFIDELIAKVCQTHLIPCSFCGIHLNHGFWGPTLVKQENMARYAEFLATAKASGVSPSPLNASIGVTNTIISSLFVKDILMYLAGIDQVVSLNRMLHLSFDSCETKELARF